MIGIKPSQPAAEGQNPFVPPGPEPLMFEEFNGINTATTRPGVDDKQAYWLDGFMPLARRNLRTMYGIGPALWTTVVGTQISFFDFANIGTNPIMVDILSDGSIYQVNTNTLVQTRIAAPGTIQTPTRLNVGISQYGSQYVIIVAKQTNGYFVWDGTLLYKAGGLAPNVTITNVGTGYTSAPTVTASGGSGTGATFLATVSAGGQVTSIVITNPGTGYLAGDTVTLGFSGGGGSAAAATVTLMPFALGGTAVETYSGRVWVANGATITYSAPGSVYDFSSANGGGNFTSNDSFLRVNFTALKQTNGFLYLIADSSINYISGVQTSGSPLVTTFTNQNADPEVGTPWPGTVNTFGRNIVFANAFGAHVSYGAAVTKISEALDGVYNTVPNFGGLIPSAAKAIIFGKKVWMILLPIIDPVTGLQVNKLFLWNGKIFWSSPQEIVLRYIQHQEINSIITAYGTDGTSVYPLFNQPSIGFTKTAQTRLWDMPGGYQLVKSSVRLWLLAIYYSYLSSNLQVNIDNENALPTSSSYAITLGPAMLTWTNNSNQPISWTNNSAQPIIWYTSGTSYAVMGPQAIGQQGVLTGMTITTQAADMALVSAMMQDAVVGYRG